MYSVMDSYRRELTERTDYDPAYAAYARMRPTQDVYLVYWLTAQVYSVIAH